MKKLVDDKKALSADAAADKALQQQKKQKTKNNESVLQRNTKFKKRNWACVIYPESLPENWLEILQKTGLKIAISSLHDKDLEADGKTHKKAHYHVILVYNGPTSYNVVKTLTDQLNAPSPIALEAVRGYYRYFTHKDNPEKYQYDEKEIRCLNGFNILDYVEITLSESTKIKNDIQCLIRKLDISEYCDLMDYIQDTYTYNSNEYVVASTNTFFFNSYLKSRNYSKDSKIKDNKAKKQEHIEKTKHKSDSTIKILQQLDELKGKDTKNISPNKPSSAVAPADENNDELPPFEIW